MVINWDEIRREYETSSETLASLAEKYGVKLGTLKSRKSREGWSRDATEEDATELQKVATMYKKDATVKSGSEVKREAFVESDELTDKQRLFVMEYLRDFNATRAAVAVGYSKKTAYSIGWELLRKPEIQAEIQRQKEDKIDALGLDVQRVIAEYMKIAFADITDYAEFGQQDMPIFTKKGPVMDPNTGEVMTVKESFVAFRDHNEVDGTVISEVKQGKDGVSIKLHDKMKALEKLERYVGFMTEEQRLKVEKLRAEVKVLEAKEDADVTTGLSQLADAITDSIRKMGERE